MDLKFKKSKIGKKRVANNVKPQIEPYGYKSPQFLMIKDIQKLRNIDQFGVFLKNELDIRLTKEGYEITREEHHSESFGSRYWV